MPFTPPALLPTWGSAPVLVVRHFCAGAAMRVVRPIVVALMALACGGGDSGDDGGTGPEPNVLPTALYSVGAAYDQARNRLVVFGGSNNGSVSGDTWEWDGAAWTRMSRSGPPARNWPALAYDAKRQRVVLFGGDAGATRFSDTWEWN